MIVSLRKVTALTILLCANFASATVYHCGNVYQDKPCLDQLPTIAESKIEDNKKLANALYIIEKYGTSLQLLLVANRAAVDTLTFQLMVKEVGFEKAQIIVNKEIEKLIPVYQQKYNLALASSLAEILSAESLQSIKTDGKASKYLQDLKTHNAELSKLSALKVNPLLTELLTKAMDSGFSQIVPNKSNISSIKKADWLKTLKPIEVSYQCSNSPIGRQFKGTRAECNSKIENLFDKCAYKVANVQIPEVLTTQKEAEKNGTVLSECIAAYYFGGDHLKLFNNVQNKTKASIM